MIAPPTETPSPEALVAQLAASGRAAQRVLARADHAAKAKALRGAAQALREDEPAILAANAEDLAAG
ncbi:MAG TPA: gamma-glutamyl-phosphate reductase, partial [Novosphingobium sp.]|nr:gamma-glutamyl-phosphate reductase [Novosphingobium sp.]